MAAPITHIVLSEKLFGSKLSQEDFSNFCIGTSFPDIRYLGVIDRKKTHFENISLVNIDLKNPFDAGLKFHSLVDLRREEYMIKNQIYDLFPKHKFSTQSLKIAEDIWLYDKVTNWNFISKCFDEMIEQEIVQIDIDSVKKRHEILRNYFLCKPSKTTIQDFVHKLGFSSDQTFELLDLVNNILLNDIVHQKVLYLYENAENIFV